jgi:hypothetical protein
MLSLDDVCWVCYEKMGNELYNLILECYMSKTGKLEETENSTIYANFCEKSLKCGKSWKTSGLTNVGSTAKQQHIPHSCNMQHFSKINRLILRKPNALRAMHH